MEISLDSYFDELDTMNIKDEKKSTSCCDNNDNYMIDDEVIICKKCNNIINNIIDTPEWKNYKNTGITNNTRCGMPTNILLPDSSLGTSISTQKRGEQMNKINMYQNWNSMPYKERSLYKVFMEIEEKCKLNDIPEIIITTSKSLYKIIQTTKISRGSNRKGIIAASVYYACKDCNVPRSSKEIAHIFDINIKVMTKGCKNFTEIMRLNPTSKLRIQSHKSISINDFIDRFSHQLVLNKNDISNIFKLAELAKELNMIDDNTPPSMAAGCILLYSSYFNLNITKYDISNICKISEVTILKCFKKLNSSKEIDNYLSLIKVNKL